MKETRAERQARELRISPLWARNAGGAGTVETKQEEIIMDEKQKAELQARNKQLEQMVAELSAKNDAVSKAQLDAARAELSELQAKMSNAKLQEEIQALRAQELQRVEVEAQAEVDRLVSLGVIGTMEKELKASHIENFRSNPKLIELSKKTHTRAIMGGDKLPPKATDIRVRSEITADLHGALKSIAEISASSGKEKGIVQSKFQAATEVSAIYKREIQPLFNKGVNYLPLEAAAAADTLGTLSGTLVALRTLDLYKYEFPILSQITTDFSDLPAQFNQTTATRVITVPAVLSYSATIGSDGRPAGYVIATPATTTDANVTLNRHRAVDIQFDANAIAATQRKLFEEFGPAAAYALGKDVVDYLYSLIITGTFTSNAAFAVAAINFGKPTFNKAARILNKQGAPMTNRFALVNSDYFETLLADPTLVSLAVFQQPQVIERSELPEIAKFRCIEAPNLPTTGNLAAFFAHKSALIMQARIPNDWSTVFGSNASYGSVNVVTNPDTGLSVLMVQFSNPQSAHAEFRLALMYGAAAGDIRGGQIVTSA